MWCGHCQQDVPAVAATRSGAAQCARCQRPIDRAQPVSQPVAAPTTAAAPRRVDADERYRRIGQTLRAAQRRAAPIRSDAKLLRLDASGKQPLFATTPQPVRPILSRPARPPREVGQHGQRVAWLMALTGALGLGAGLGLIGWSLVGARPDLWNWGLFATLGGQGLLVVGLTQLLASLWMSARASAGRLVSLQNEIVRLQRSTEALTGDRTATATRFYADLARGASPERLVANLRGQIDELGASIAGQ